MPKDDEESERTKSNTSNPSHEKHGAAECDPSLVESESAFVPIADDTGPDRSTTGGHGYDDRARVHFVPEVTVEMDEVFEHMVTIASMDKEETGSEGNMGSKLGHSLHPTEDPVCSEGPEGRDASCYSKRSLVDANVVPDLIRVPVHEKNNVSPANNGARAIKPIGVRGKSEISDVLVEHRSRAKVPPENNGAPR